MVSASDTGAPAGGGGGQALAGFRLSAQSAGAGRRRHRPMRATKQARTMLKFFATFTLDTDTFPPTDKNARSACLPKLHLLAG